MQFKFNMSCMNYVIIAKKLKIGKKENLIAHRLTHIRNKTTSLGFSASSFSTFHW